MARITYSPLVVDARGSVADCVFSKWKGRSYIRSRVTPANPKTAAQTLVRESLKRTVALYQSLQVDPKNAWDLHAGAQAISGYNDFVSANRSKEQAGDVLTFTPHNPDVPKLSGVSIVEDTQPGKIDVSWTDPGIGADAYVYIVTRADGVDSLVVQTSDSVLASAGTYIISGLVAGALYDVYISIKLDSDNEMGESSGAIDVVAGS